MILITNCNRLFECIILSHLYYIVECATEFVFYCVLGSTTEWRMEDDIALDYSTIYGSKESGKYGAKNILIPEALAKNMTQVAMPCSLCNRPIFCEIAGLHVSQIVQGKCTNRRCLNYTALPMQHQISYYWPLNLTAVFLTLSNDSGYPGVQAIAWSHNLQGMSKDAYQRHCKFIYKTMENFYEANQMKAIESVKQFYKRNREGPANGIEDEDGILEICITLDGAYGRRGTHT